MRKLDFYWKSSDDWWYTNEYEDDVIRESAPPKAQESYKHYLEQLRSERKLNETEKGENGDIL